MKSGVQLPMCPCRGLISQYFDNMKDILHMQFKDEMKGQYWIQLYETEIHHTKSQQTDMEGMVAKQHQFIDKKGWTVKCTQGSVHEYPLTRYT